MMQASLATGAKPIPALPSLARPPVAEARRVERRRVRGSIELRPFGGRVIAGGIADISVHGCSVIADESGLRLGQFVALAFAHCEPVQAIVRWVRDAQAGLEFLQPVDGAVLDRFDPIH